MLPGSAKFVQAELTGACNHARLYAVWASVCREIMRHDKADDLWGVVEGRVWDMTEFIATDHPGGEEIPTEYGACSSRRSCARMDPERPVHRLQFII